MINMELRDKWIAALRSDRFEQCTGEMHGGGNKRCALGVLCEVAELPLGPSCRNVGPSEMARLFRYEVLDAVEVMNDRPGITPFPEIADWIEKHVVSP